MKKIYYVTGCLGLIGSNVTRLLLENKDNFVYGVDKCTYAANLNLLPVFTSKPNFKFIKEDISNLKFLNDCDYIINTAAESHVDNSILNGDSFISSNILGVKNLLDLIKNKHVNCVDRPKLIHFSTDEVYGDIVSGSHTETDILKPSNPYSASKAAADMLILAWARTYNINYVIVRPTNNYGIGQYPEKLIPLAIKNLDRGKKIKLHNEGKPIRTWLHTSDTAQAILKIIEAKVENEIYNISGGFEQTNLKTIERVVKCFFEDNVNIEEYVDLEYKREGQDVRYSLNDSKIRSLGWKPVKVFDVEIKKIVDYYKKNFKW